jgi:hypothetical protein
MIDIEQKRCTACGNIFPATLEYFHIHKQKGGTLRLRSECKTCRSRKETLRKQRNGHLPTHRFCSICKETKPLTPEYFHRNKSSTYGFGYWCKECDNRMKQSAPSRQPSTLAATSVDASKQCGSCGTTRGNIFGDINTSTFEKYGNLCMKCHQLVRDFGGDPIRMRNVLAYIEKTRGSQV